MLLNLPVGSVSFVFLLSLCIAFAVGLMLIWHLYLVASSQTTIEFYTNQLQKQHMAQRGFVRRSYLLDRWIGLVYSLMILAM